MAKKSVQPPVFEEDEIKEIINKIFQLEEEKYHIGQEIKNLKTQAEGLGVTKKEMAEALRLLGQNDDERNLTLTGVNRILKAVDRKEINTNFIGE